MADNPNRVYSITVTVQPGTLPGAPQSTPWVTEDNTIVSIEFEIPPGHNGLTGIRLTKGGSQILPFSGNTWITANGYSRVFAIDDYMPTRDLTVETYNQGAYPHSFYLRMTVVDYTPSPVQFGATEAGALNLGSPSTVTDPLSPDSLLGPDTVDALITGQLTPADLAPVDASALIPQGAPS